MNTLEILFFVLLFIVFYTYVGYGILLWILVKIKQSFLFFYDTDEPEQETCRNGNNTDLPEITLFITAYNEEQVVDRKMKKLPRTGLSQRETAYRMGNGRQQ